MIPFAALLLAPFIAQDAGLRWDFDGTVRKSTGRYDLVRKELRGDVTWFVATKGSFSPDKLYESDVSLTKDAPASKGFVQTKSEILFAGKFAIQSDQKYSWNGAPVASRCVYCAAGKRAWVIRLWWPPASQGAKAATAFLRSVKELGS